MMFRRLSAFFFAATLLATGASFAMPAHAQVTAGLNEIGQTVKLSSANPITIAVRIINVALGLIGIILVALILYAGFLYMTSGGEAAKTTQAKKIITNAIIGLIIILSAWAITNFVIASLLNATQSPGGGVGGGGPGGGGGGFGGGGGAAAFQVKSMTPAGSVPIRNVQVKIVFTKSVDEASTGAIVVAKGGTAVPGTISVSGSVVSFTPSAPCPSPNQSKFCFDGDSDFTITIGGSVRSTQGQTVTCGGFGGSCTGAFHTGNIVDTQAPSVNLTFPTDGMKVQQNFLQDLQAETSDDSGIATVEFFDGSNTVDVDGPNATSTPLQFTAHGSWDTTGAVLGLHTLSATAADIDTNTTQSSGVNVVVRPAHCFNNQLDANVGETGIDCGGDPNSADFCGACSGGACTKNSDCSSGFCINGFCAEKPVIQTVSPLDGQPGTFVTIKGVNFGSGTGVVTFLGGPGAQDDTIGAPPAACVNANIGTWSNTQVIVAVPGGAASGPIEIKNTGSGLTDDTNDANGPQVPNFVANNAVHPGLCGLNPNSGTTGSQADLIGAGFGGAAGNVEFGKTQLASPFAAWSDPKITITVPVVNSAPYDVSVKVGNQLSNPATFTVVDKNAGAAPELDSMDPGQGAKQTYVTLFGKNFGFSVGTVVFTDQNGQEAIGDTSFPAECSDGFWRDDQIMVKVPKIFKNNQPLGDGTYKVKVTRPDLQSSNVLSFGVDSSLPELPGICAIEPAVGPVGTDVTLYGEHFGGQKPSVTFAIGQQALVNANTQQQVATNVPNQSVTGPVQLKTGAALQSNKVDFEVRNCNEASNVCGPSEQCCASGECLPKNKTCGVKAQTAEFAWQTSTGLIPIAPTIIEECRPDLTPSPTPSPAPWLGRTGGDSAPIDAAVTMRFSQLLESSTVTQSSFRLLRCTSAASEPCTTTQPVSFTLSDKASNAQEIVKLTPSQPFVTSTTYLVDIVSTIKSKGANGTEMDVMTSCGTGPGNETYGYCFRFKTKDSTDSSTVGAVNVVPNSLNVHDTGVIPPSPAYEAEPLDAADKCIVLDCNRFDWTWFTGASLLSQDARASVTNKKLNGLGACDQDVSAIAETGNNPAAINAQLPQGMLGTGNLFVSFIPPAIDSYAPNCDKACLNDLIWAQATEQLDPTSLAGNIIVQQCYNENCVESELLPKLQIPAGNMTLIPPFGSQGEPPRVISIAPKQGNNLLLQPGQFYRVLLKSGPNVANGGIRGKNGLPISNLNNPLGFTWTFRVKLASDGAICTADHVDVVPLQKYESVVGASQMFVATPFGKPDECSASGQALMATAGTQWDSSAPGVAQLYNNGQVDTGGNLPAGCSGSCLATGAYATFGKVSICGNDVIETTDAHFCVNGKTPKGDNCTLMPAGANAGEECEPTIDGNLCDVNTCLFRPVAVVAQGGTCGNGVVDKNAGEACDFGPTCVGASNSTSTPVAENSPCSAPAAKTACASAGGTCAMHDYRGCSANCLHLGSNAGKTTCGNGDVNGDGKSCDDGNQTSGDGCSAICLHEPSQPSTQLSAICGNGILEDGETCEAKIVAGQPVFPAGCNQTTCLHTGTTFCASGNSPNCCGNGKIENGEDCDDNNHVSGDGCSSSCLLEGSSPNYSSNSILTPSFCGNGILEQGEQCEVGAQSSDIAKAIKYGTPNASYDNVLNTQFGAGDGDVDNAQLAQITGTDTPDPNTGKMSSQISAALEGQTGTSTYGLQCGFTDEASCPAGLGLDTNGCCARRPKINTPYPQGQGVCRNVQISVQFQDFMDVGATINNIEIDQSAAGNDCPIGTKAVVAQAPAPPVHGLFAWVKLEWHTFVAWISGQSTNAQVWCTGSITGQLTPVGTPTSTKMFVFTLDHALEASTVYRVRFKADNSTAPDPLSDNADLANRIGIKTVRGVVHPSNNNGDLEWTFKTGTQICTANVVTVLDVTPDPNPPQVSHPYLFTNDNNQPETRQFLATAQSVQNNQAIPLSPIPEYAWNWTPWTSSDKKIVTVQGTPGQQTTDAAQAVSTQQNGNAILTATMQITNDTISVPPSTSSTVQGIAPVAVLVCENPWPSLKASPFRDANPSGNVPSSFKPGDPFYGLAANQYYNFSTMYCRDAGNGHDKTDDIPAIKINQIPPTPLDSDKGILRQYLFSYPADTANTPDAYRGLQKDGIGIRIVSNPKHLSPLEWYHEQGFTGSPTPVTVDGYPAIQDGTTIYVAASNRPGVSSGPIYSNIYLISENPDAAETTKQVYDQMVKYLAFNINILNQSNVCVDGSNAPPAGDLIDCSADWECFQTGRLDLHCDSLKLKLTRDTQRMADFQAMTSAFEAARTPQGTYPQAVGGTFLRNISTSLWSSWQSEVSKSLGIALPNDPVNHFLTCGECSITKLPCQSVQDCPVQANGQAQTCDGGYRKNGQWTANANVDPQSCWDQTDHQFICPNISNTAAGVSRIYQFKSLAGGARYDLGSEFEVPPPGNLANWWSPQLPDAVFRCASTSTFGNFCNGAGGQPDDKLCRVCAAGNCKTCASGSKQGQSCNSSGDCGGINIPCTDSGAGVIKGSCQQTGGSYTYQSICTNMPTGDNGTCGDGVLNTGEICDAGMTQSATCGNGGFKQQVCNLTGPLACNSWVDDPQHPQCVQGVSCGNGRIDRKCNNIPSSPACLTDADCNNVPGACAAVESCDEGALNGTYGHCNTSCQGYSGYCGDGQLSPGEICDKGPANGQWSNNFNASTCSLDCKSNGPYCGDNTVNGPEQCDGTTLTTQSAICSSGPNVNQTCTTNADCGLGGTCGGGVHILNKYDAGGANPAGFDSCAGAFITVGGFKRETQHTRTCGAPGSATACKLDTWSMCEAVGSCGDGVQDTGEECDDGGANGDTAACTSQCKKNVCGDGNTYEGTEECDQGANNGKTTCTADYNSMCLSCSTLCKFQASAGGYCGDLKKNGPEQCDGVNSVPNSVTCQSLGYDYADSVADLRRTDSASGLCTIYPNADSHDGITFGDKTDVQHWNIYASQWGGTDIPGLLKQWSDAGYPLTQEVIQALESGADSDPNNQWSFDCPAGQTNVTFDTKGGPVTCSNSCTFGGCERCSDQPGIGVIKGRVFDAVYQEVVPGARVSLLFKGQKVDEAYTDDDGLFSLTTLNTNAACTGYRIVIDMYQDNPCTNPEKTEPPTVGYTTCDSAATPPWPSTTYNPDEGALGGYFPYTSPTFTAATFGSVMNGLDTDATSTYHIDIFPRPPKGQAYSAITWTASQFAPDAGNPTIPGPIWYKEHTIVPSYAAFTRVNWDADPPEVSKLCSYDSRPAGSAECIRDITWQAEGSYDLTTAPPYGRLLCLHRAGEKTEGSSNPKFNGCPIEGTTDCENNFIINLTGSACTTLDLSCVKAWASGNNIPNFSVYASQQIQAAKTSCADDANHTCAKDSDFSNCFEPSHFGPITTLMNFAPYSLKSGDIHFYFTDTFGNNPTTFKSDLSKGSFTAYVAYSPLNGQSELLTLSSPAGTGWAWHVADINAQEDKLVKVNTLSGSAGDPQTAAQKADQGVEWKPADPQNGTGQMDGMGAWAYWFQAPGTGVYCASTSNNKKILSSNAVCFYPNEQAACTNGYKCGGGAAGPWDQTTYSHYNW